MSSFSNGKHHKCPLCESPCNEEIERHVQSELYKMLIDPTYKPKTVKESKLK